MDNTTHTLRHMRPLLPPLPLHTHTYAWGMYIRARARTHTNTHTHTHSHHGKRQTDYNGAGKGQTNHAASKLFGTICHHMVTKPARVIKHAVSVSNLTPFSPWWQNVPQHTLPMWVQIKWHCKLVHGCMVYTEHVPRQQQFHVAPVM